MLSKIKLTNFRQHRSLELSFGEGLTAIRGANEAGKSTLGEAIAYANFGVKALRSPLAEVVTWGEPEATLKVELDQIIDGVTYCIKRGKSGAECVYGGDGIVTGQTEVSNFMGRLLKVDVSSAAKLMFSNQKEIASALESGTKATTELIERLAEFDQIDKLIDLMQEKLTLGSGASALGQLDAATARVDRAKEVQEPDFDDLKLAEGMALLRVTRETASLEAAQRAKDTAQTNLAKAQAAATQRNALEARLTRFESRYTDAMAELGALKATVVPLIAGSDEKIQQLLAEKADSSAAAAARTAWKEVRSLVGDAGIARFKGSAEDFQQAQAEAQKGLDAARAALRKGDVQLAALQAKMNSGNCTFCGKDFSDLPEVQAKNAQLQECIDLVSAELSDAEKSADEFQLQIKGLSEIQAGGKATLAAIQKHAQYLSIDAVSYPPFFAWKGDEPDLKVGDGFDYDAAIRAIRQQVRASSDHAAAVKANDNLLESFGAEREELKAQQAELGRSGVPLDDLVKSATLADATVKASRDHLNNLTTALNEARDNFKDATRNWKWAKKEASEAAAAVELAREALVTLDFNNALLKKVRSARPVIADKLWNLVLTSVSSYFSEMRGEKSRVTKGPDGFMIDDHPVPSFSGSTIDILGLAIRVALVRTFLPSCPFLLLDEPAAACSDARTDNMLGFLQGCGYKQILLITHEDVSESVADHIITLGE